METGKGLLGRLFGGKDDAKPKEAPADAAVESEDAAAESTVVAEDSGDATASVEPPASDTVSRYPAPHRPTSSSS